MRELVIAQKNRERTAGVEQERVQKDQQLEQVERERVVELKRIEKDKMLEEEKKIIQDAIRQRIEVERAVVQEEERIKDTRQFAEADRNKKVAIVAAEQAAEQSLVKQVKEAEAAKQSATFRAEKSVIEAEAERQAAAKSAEARKLMAEGLTAQEAAKGIAEAKVLEAKARALKEEGQAKADVTQAQAIANEKQGLVEAQIIGAKAAAEAQGVEARLTAEATGVRAKAEAMKELDGVGRDHEEFKLRLQKEKEIELAEIQTREAIAESQSKALAEAFKAAHIEVVGGETEFFHNIVGAVANGKRIDKMFKNSETLSAARDGVLGALGRGNGKPGTPGKPLSLASHLAQLAAAAPSDGVRKQLADLVAQLEKSAAPEAVPVLTPSVEDKDKRPQDKRPTKSV